MRKILIFTSVFTMISMFSQKMQGQTNEKKGNETKQVSTADYTTTASGLKYKITSKGKGIQPKAGDKVEVHYLGKLPNDTVFDSSYPRGQALPFFLGKGQVIKGWDEGVGLLHVGDKATFIIPPNIAYGERAMGKIPANATLIFEVELVKVTPKVVPVPFDIKGKKVVETASGLKYVIIQEGTGRIPFNGANVSAHYTGYFEDGKIFDSSIERGQPFTFPVGKGKVIKAWDEAFSIFKVGTKARLLVPYSLAYGERGSGSAIPPKTNLIFDVELIEYK